MQQPIASPYPVSDFIEWDASRQLVIAPKFQRRDVWEPKAKSYLIDTILRSMPIPPLYIRLVLDPTKKRTVREVVDGQQRLRAVLSYIHDDFPIMSVHNQEYPDKYYTELSEDIQKKILAYKFNVNVLENISDAEVLSIFARINTYTVKLNDQELRNAEFFGAFKQTVYKLALQHYAFWETYIFSDMQIARMDEAELVSELIVSMLDGIRQTKKKDLRVFYENYDDKFSQKDKIKREFSSVIDTIGDILGDSLKTSNFRRIPLFYSLFLVIYDAKFGLPKSEKPRISFTSARNKSIKKLLEKIDNIITAEEPPLKYQPFINAAKLSTADVGKRRLRHKFLWDNVLSRVVNE